MLTFRTMIVSVLAASSVACATYEPPNLPKDQLATVTPIQPGGLQHIEFVQIDDVWVQRPFFSFGVAKIRSPVKLAPGKHQINVRLTAANAAGGAQLWLVAEPGKEYFLRCESAGYRFRAWFEDVETGKPVGGMVGSSDEPK